MRRTILSITLLTSAFLLAGCHYILDIVTYNHTGSDVTVTTMNAEKNSKDHVIRSDEAAQISYPFQFQIKQQNRVWNYSTTKIPLEFHKKKGFNKHVVNIQIEPDGLIYLLLPNWSFPTTSFPAQPPGFPLRPTVNK